MLSGAVKKFLSECETVSVIARHENGFKKIISGSNFPQRLNPIITDYSDADLLSGKLMSSIHSKGAVSIAVSWIHSHSEKSHEIIGDLLNSQNINSEYYNILGSAYYNPSNISSDTERIFSKYRNIFYKRIILGFKTENGISRWLTNDEISAGVTEAVTLGADEYKIGLTEPWKKKQL